MNTYLGPKGYTISKAELTNQQQIKIRNDLMIKPFVMGSPNNDDKTFPAYRESPTRFFVPHYYGVEHFGVPKQYKIAEGTDINLVFHGKLRDYQEPVVNKFVNHCLNTASAAGGLLELYCAWGKTSASLNIITRLKKKTLVIVHKEFLMNQWIERIKQFLPEARVGKIQGPVIDVDDKDIVIGMLQSLISKEYEPTLFAQFGFTIIDEVHHISSQSFSNSLFRIVTKYMLGLSATMDRKDGTTAVFKMFLGDVVYKSEKKNDHTVEVRAVTYKVNDDEFNETIMNYKGQVQNSSMISKLCEYSRRTEFIIKTLCDFICVGTSPQETMAQHKQAMDLAVPNCEICNKNNNYLIRNTCCDTVKYCMGCMEQVEEEYGLKKSTKAVKAVKERPKCPNCKKCLKYEQHYIENSYVKPLEQTHTIVMAHNLNILHYIYSKMVCKNLASVGYYVGGMDEASLKKSEKKQIILATYSMAQEGLDIPTLNAEFLISPKTDIIQIVGRILRAKHDYSHPIIYDFVDSHDVFQRQWAKRKSYYKKQNYKIIGSNSMDYTKWKIINEPKNVFLLCNKAHILSDDDDDDKDDDKDDDNDDDNKNPIVNEICLLKNH